MYEVIFYRDKDGKEPLLDYLKKLAAKSDKDSRINLNKILQYIDILKTYGTAAGEKYVKHIEGEIYELRPLRNRIMFAEWTGKEFILLSHFIKKTQKTPRREIELAERRLKESRDRDE